MQKITLTLLALVVGALQTPTPVDKDLLTATRRGDCRAVAGLLKKRADPNARDEEMATPLIRAATACQAPVLAQLLDSGADIEARDEQGRTALLLAIERDPPEGEHRRFQLDVVRLLLTRKASTTVKDEDGGTVLHYAATQRNLDVLTLFLGMGLSVDVRNKDGATPLFQAAAYGYGPSVSVLIAAGADVNTRINSGPSAVSVATERGHSDIVQLLRSRGAPVDGKPSVPTGGGGSPLSPIEGISLEQWARANGRLTADVPLDVVLGSLGLTKAQWERAHEQWSRRLSENVGRLGTNYATHFRAAMDEEVAKRTGRPATEAPITFEKWVEVQQASAAAAQRVPQLYEMTPSDWTRVSSWWNQRLSGGQVDRSTYDQLSEKYRQQFASRPPARAARVLRDGALEANREPVALETWIEMQQAHNGAQEWTLKRHGLTSSEWLHATTWWSRKLNEALVGGKGTAVDQAERTRMYAEHTRLSEIYRKKYANSVPWQ
jgi:ankyrin repeat protein